MQQRVHLSFCARGGPSRFLYTTFYIPSRHYHIEKRSLSLSLPCSAAHEEFISLFSRVFESRSFRCATAREIKTRFADGKKHGNV